MALSVFLNSDVSAQTRNLPLLIEQSIKVLGEGIATDMSSEALMGLYREARISTFSVKLAIQRKRTVILTQDYVVYSYQSNVPTWIKRKVILNQSAHYGELGDDDCAVKILQLGSFATDGRLLTSLTHQIEIPRCEFLPVAGMLRVQGFGGRQQKVEILPVKQFSAKLEESTPATPNAPQSA